MEILRLAAGKHRSLYSDAISTIFLDQGSLKHGGKMRIDVCFLKLMLTLVISTEGSSSASCLASSTFSSGTNSSLIPL